jgi:hypothetical protein
MQDAKRVHPRARTTSKEGGPGRQRPGRADARRVRPARFRRASPLGLCGTSNAMRGTPSVTKRTSRVPRPTPPDLAQSPRVASRTPDATMRTPWTRGRAGLTIRGTCSGKTRASRRSSWATRARRRATSRARRTRRKKPWSACSKARAGRPACVHRFVDSCSRHACALRP